MIKEIKEIHKQESLAVIDIIDFLGWGEKQTFAMCLTLQSHLLFEISPLVLKRTCCF